MNLIILIISLLSIFLIVEGFRIVFSKQHFNKLMETTWKDSGEIMGKKEGIYYFKLRGISMLLGGLMALIVCAVVFFQEFS